MSNSSASKLKSAKGIANACAADKSIKKQNNENLFLKNFIYKILFYILSFVYTP